MPLASGGRKQCTKCGAVKPVSEFQRNRATKDGLFVWCGECSRRKSREYRAANLEKHTEGVRRWQRANKERRTEYQRRYYAANPEKYREYTRRHREKNAEKITASRRRRHLKKLFGLSMEEFDAMVEKQNGVCLLCLEPPPEGKVLCVDHCHDSGAIRGLLCQRCNRTLGLYDDNADWFARAARYLRKHKKG